MGFVARDSVEALDYDLTPYGGTGTIAEPSDDQQQAMFDRLRSMVTEMGLVSGQSPESISDALEAAPENLLARAKDAVLDALGEVCGDSPSREELSALPPRPRAKFLGWLTGELSDPTSSSVGMTPSPAARNGAGRSTSSAAS